MLCFQWPCLHLQGCPVCRWCPRVLVVHRGNIACAARVLVFKPGPSDRGILVVAHQFEVQRADVNLVGEIDGTGTAADYNDADLSCKSARLLDNLIGRVVCVAICGAIQSIGMKFLHTDRSHIGLLRLRCDIIQVRKVSRVCKDQIQ